MWTDMCIHIVHMRVHAMCVDMRDRCLDVCIDMCTEICVDLCVDMCIGMCIYII